MKLRPASGLFVFFFIISCSQDIEPKDPSVGYDFFPLEIGKYWIYQVDSIIYDFALGGISIDTIRHYVLDEISSQYTDTEGNEVFVISKFGKRSESDDWFPNGTWSAYISDLDAFKKEDNWLFVKLRFPPRLGLKWNGNAYLDESVTIRIADEPVKIFKDWDHYEIVEEILSEEIAGTQYTDLITVLQVDHSSAIERRYSIEKFATGTGMVYKEMHILDVSCKGIPSDPCPEEIVPWDEKAERGFILKQVLIESN